MMRIFFILLISGLNLLTAFAQVESPPQTIISAIPPYHPGSSLKGNPVVLLLDSGAFINGSSKPVAYDQVVKELTKLPPSAWPHGRAIQLSSFPGLSISSIGVAEGRKIENQVLAELKAADIAVFFMPSA